MRNRNLSLLARRDLRLKSIAIGHASVFAYGKPRITNQVALLPSQPELQAQAHISCHFLNHLKGLVAAWI